MTGRILPVFFIALAMLISLDGYEVPVAKPLIENIFASSAQPDFELTANPSNVTLALNDIANITIHVHSIAGFNGHVELALTQPINSDVGPSCPGLDQSKTVAPNPDAAWSFTCTSGDNAVIYTLQIRGRSATAPTITHTVEITLNFKPSDIANSNSYPGYPQLTSIPPIYLIAGSIGLIIVTLVALTRRPFKPANKQQHT